MARLFFMVGLPSSGKSMYAKKLVEQYGATIHSSDAIREELFGDIGSQEDNGKVFQVLHERVKEDLKNGINTIFDATNISYKKRMSFIDEIKHIKCIKICVFMATPYEDCVKYNLARDRKVPTEVITRMYKNFYVPQYYEGWNEIWIKWNFDNRGKYSEDPFIELDEIDQENPHHTLTIGEHCKETFHNIFWKTDNGNLRYAALYHDVGKNKCKEYNQEKGCCTYYQHNLVSAYDTVFYLGSTEVITEEDILEVVRYITWHMVFYSYTSQKPIDKLIELIGQDEWKNLVILNEADKSAH